MQNTAAQISLRPITPRELEPSHVAIKASTIPLDRPVVRRHGADKDGQQVHGAVEVVQHRPRHLPGQDGEHVVDPEGYLEGAAEAEAGRQP